MSRRKAKKVKFWLSATTIIVLLSAIGIVSVSMLIRLKDGKASANFLSATTIVQLVNQERTSNGLQPLAENSLLSTSGQNKANDMAKNQYFSHYRPVDNKRGLSFISDTGYTYQSAGENLAIYFETEAEIVQAWMQSTSHRQNILKNSYTETGVGVATGEYQGYKTFYVVQFFGTPQAQAPIQEARTTPSEVKTPETPSQKEQAQDSSQPQEQVKLPEKSPQQEQEVEAIKEVPTETSQSSSTSNSQGSGQSSSALSGIVLTPPPEDQKKKPEPELDEKDIRSLIGQISEIIEQLD